MYQNVIYYPNGTIVVVPLDNNQMVQGNGRYVAPSNVNRIDLQSSEGSTSTIWNYKWSEPWRGSI